MSSTPFWAVAIPCVLAVAVIALGVWREMRLPQTYFDGPFDPLQEAWSSEAAGLGTELQAFGAVDATLETPEEIMRRCEQQEADEKAELAPGRDMLMSVVALGTALQRAQIDHRQVKIVLGGGADGENFSMALPQAMQRNPSGDLWQRRDFQTYKREQVDGIEVFVAFPAAERDPVMAMG